MYKAILLLAVILMIVVASISCQESGLSEAEINAMVQAEVANQLADLDELTLSNLYIENDDGDIVTHLTSNPQGNGELSLSNSGNEIIAFIGSFGQEITIGVYCVFIINTEGMLFKLVAVCLGKECYAFGIGMETLVS